MSVRTFRKKPVEIEAVQWAGDNAAEIKAFVGRRDNGEDGFLLPSDVTGTWHDAHVYDFLHETWMTVYVGQWIIKGVKGEVYPIDATVLAETYEPVSGSAVVNVHVAGSMRSERELAKVVQDAVRNNPLRGR